MTSINSIVSTTTTATSAVSGRHHQRQDPMAKVADALGMSGDDLKTELKSGKSLNDVATEKGVSHDDLIAAIKSGMPSGAASGTDADATAEKIADTKGMPKPPNGGHGGPKGMGSGLQDSGKLDAVKQLLDSDDVSSSTSATDLVKKLQDKGVDLSALKNVLNNGDLLDVAA
jgi:hypothetical protein